MTIEKATMLANLDLSIINLREGILSDLDEMKKRFHRVLTCSHEFRVDQSIQSAKYIYLDCQRCQIRVMSLRDPKDVIDDYIDGLIYERFMSEVAIRAEKL